MRPSYLYEDPSKKEESFVSLQPRLVGRGWLVPLVPGERTAVLFLYVSSQGYGMNVSESCIWL